MELKMLDPARCGNDHRSYNGWGYWPVMGEQVEGLRRRYNTPPAEAFLPGARPLAASPA